MDLSEQETTMTWDSEQKIVRIFSARGVDQRKLAKAGILPTKDTQPHGLFYEIPLSRLFWKVRLLVSARAGQNNLRKRLPSVGITDRKGTPDGN